MIFHAMGSRLVLLSVMIGAVTAVGLTSCSTMLSKTVYSDTGGGWLRIQSSTILQDIHKGDIDIFESAPDELSSDSSIMDPVQWTQVDYEEVTKALYENEFSETSSDWLFSRSLFKLDCRYAHLGPQSATFDLFRIIHSRDKDSRIERSIFIQPLLNRVGWSEREANPNQANWRGINLTQVNIHAEDALHIAEQQGGQAVRESVQDNCAIYVTMIADHWDGDWKVSYAGFQSQGDLFRIYVDEESGAYRLDP